MNESFEGAVSGPQISGVGQKDRKREGQGKLRLESALTEGHMREF